MIALRVLAQQMLHPPEQADNDFLNALLSGSDSVSGSPLWSPSPSDSGISEDPPSDQMDSPQRSESPHGDAHYFGTRSQTKAALEANISIDLSKSHISRDSGETGRRDWEFTHHSICSIVISLIFIIVYHTNILMIVCLLALYKYPCVCVGADDWEPSFPSGRTRITQYPPDAHRLQMSSGFPLTVKDLLLSGTMEAVSVSQLW